MFDRITAEPDKMGGVPCIRGLRIPVATVVGMVADGMTEQEILQAYPDLEASYGSFHFSRPDQPRGSGWNGGRPSRSARGTSRR
jgi:hypothetical protein